jgi:hypothetical protein
MEGISLRVMCKKKCVSLCGVAALHLHKTTHTYRRGRPGCADKFFSLALKMKAGTATPPYKPPRLCR